MQPMPPQPAPPPSGGSETAIHPGEIVLWASAGVALIFSFFGWSNVDARGFSNLNAWSGGDTDFSVFPLATYVPLFIIASAAISLMKRFGNVSFGLEQYIGISGKALQRAFAWFAFLLAFGWLLFIDSDIGRGIGLWFSILAAIGAVVGNVLIDRLPSKPKAVAAPGQWGAPPAPGGYQQQPGYAAPQPPQQQQPPAPQPPAPQQPAPQQPPAPQPPPPAPAPQPQPPAPPPAPPAPAPPPSPQTPPPAPGTPPPPPPG